MNRNKIIILIIGFLILLIGICVFPKVDEFFKIDSCLDKGGSWNYETQECEFKNSEIIPEINKSDSLNRYNELSDKHKSKTYTVSEYNTDLETENIDKPEKSIIKKPTVDTTHLFKIWTLNPEGPHADFWFKRTEFYVVDYDGDGAMPYILNQDILTIFYNDFVQKGRIISVEKDTLEIQWIESEEPTKYTEWNN